MCVEAAQRHLLDTEINYVLSSAFSPRSASSMNTYYGIFAQSKNHGARETAIGR
jgi:hypothetical protein